MLRKAMDTRIILWTLLFSLVNYGWCEKVHCPFSAHCQCTRGISLNEEFTGIRCQRVPFSHFPAFPDSRIETLEITDSGIESLDSESFGSLTAYSMILDKNNIFSISNDTFMKMKNSLRELSLNENKLSEIPINALSPLEMLKSLSINGNQITSVIAHWLNLKDSLRVLKLNYNDIDSIPLNPETSLANLKNLDDLHLSGNLLPSLEANSLPYALKILNASDNYIKNFPNDVLNVIQELNTLDLSENNIEALEDNQFKTKVNLENLNLAYNRLRIIKKSFGERVKINKLNLSRNNISEIEKEAFSGLDCKEINLSANKLSKLDDASFKGVESTLEVLDLSHNKFVKVPSSLKELKNLKELNFAQNHLSKVKNSLYYFSGLKSLSLSGNNLGVFPVEALSSRSSISNLDLSYNKIADIRKSDFKSWGKNLHKLLLQSNSIFFLGDNTFEYTSKLAELSLSYNTIGDISLNAFKNLDNIERLDISFSLKGYGFPTPILSMKSLSFLALDNNNVNGLSEEITKLEKIVFLILDFNRIKDISSSTFDSKAHKFLKEIRLSFNFINKIESNTFSELSSLQFISLHDNKIRKVAEYGFSNLPQNLSIYLSGNQIETIEKHAFSNLPKLKKIDLHGNNLQVFEYSVFNNVSSQNEPMILNLSRNSIESLKVPDYTRAPVYIISLDLDHNKITKIPEKLVEIQPSLRILSLGYNGITELTSQDFYDMVSLESLSLVHNKITSIKSDSFVSLKKLQMLNLSHNHIEELQSGLFTNLEGLRTLDLSFNNIRTISQTAFDNTKLKSLILSNNKISDISASVFLNIGKTLRVLDLSHNQILMFNNSFFQKVPKLQNLNLCHNKLVSNHLDAFGNTSLLTLELCGNFLTSIPNNSFVNSFELRHLNLAGTGLQSFPNLTLPNLVSLEVSENKIKNMTKSSFSGMPKLRDLILKNNEISALNGIDWIQAPSLRKLDLSYNPIKVLDKPCFFGLYNLRKLNIQYLSQIDHLDSGIFMDLNELTSLKIDIDRKLGLNLNKTLAHLKYLKELSLNVMNSKFLDDLPVELPQKLRALEITGKNLKSIDSDALRSLKSFYKFELRIAGTGIDSFPKHFFNAYKAKEFRLDLSNNELYRVGPEIFFNTLGDIRRYGTKAFSGGIVVNGNKLVCGCEVKWFAEWLRRFLVETLNVNNLSIEDRLLLIENMNELTCFDKKTQQNFPILTYDLSTDEKLCGIVLSVPIPKEPSSAYRTQSFLVPLLVLLGLVIMR